MVYEKTLNYTKLVIHRNGGPAQIAASESVSVSVHTSTTTIGTSATNPVYTTKLWDSHGSFDLATGTFTAPISGEYILEAKYQGGNVSSSSSNTFVYAEAVKNSTSVGQTAFTYQVSSVSLGPNGLLVQSVKLLAGETLKFQLTRDAAVSSFSLTGGQKNNNLTIGRVGNY